MFSKRSIRVIALASVLAMSVCVFAGCSTTDSAKARIDTTAPMLSDAAALLDISAEATSGKFAATDAEKQALTGMTLRLENNYVALYSGKYTDVAVKDKQTGHIWFSNPAVYGLQADTAIVREEAFAYSPVYIEYYADNRGAAQQSMYVYGDCITEDNEINNSKVTVNDSKTVMSVQYIFGTHPDMMLYFGALSPEKFDALNERIDELYDQDRIEFRDRRLLKKLYEEPESNGTEFYRLYSSATTLELIRLSNVMREAGVTHEDIAAEETRAGYEKKDRKTSWFQLTVDYQLQNRDLLVSVDYDNVLSSDGYLLSRVAVLPCFGAGSEGTDGWIFAPNGSGSVIKNDTTTGDMTEIDIPFYGTDYGKNLLNSALLMPSNTLPVFGVQSNNALLFGIVESGDGQSGMKAAIANPEAPFNRAYPYCTMYQTELVNADVVVKLDSITEFSETMPDTTFRVRYHFLYGKDATYSRMAEYYRQYLEAIGVLEKMTQSDSLMMLEFLGSIRKKETVLGIPVTRDRALTTFEDVQTILGELSEKGIQNPSVLMSGIFNGGMDNKLNDRADIQKELGGKKGYQELVDALAEKGISFTSAISPTLLYRNGNGYSATSQTARNTKKKYATLAQYDPSTNRRSVARTAYLLSPLYYVDTMEEFVASYQKLEHNDLYLTDIGSMLPTDYNENREIHRDQSKYYAQEAVKAAADAGNRITLDGGNAYLLQYADRLVNMELESEHYELEYRSIPFTQMVLHGYVSYAGSPMNMESAPQTAFLKTVETGASLYYKLMYQENTMLLNTDFTSLYSTNYSLWVSQIAEQQEQLSALYESTALSVISEHAYITDDVVCTTYDNGTRVLVNYGKTDYTHEGVLVKANGFAVAS